MYIYKITNKLNGKWYIGKHNGKSPNYMGSGKILKAAIIKYGAENFHKEILEHCIDLVTLNRREKEIIAETNAIFDPNSYNLASGGEGGDLSKFINYAARGNKSDNFSGAREWLESLSVEEKSAHIDSIADKRSKGWYVSTVDDPTETYVQNISKWCEEHSVDKAMPTALNNPNGRLFQKQTKGWRIRRADMPMLSPYINKRKIGHENVACKGRGWRLVDGKRVWYDK